MYSRSVRKHLGKRIRRRRERGRVLAVKWGLNPNSSSLGVDVTFLLFGSVALAMVTPVVSALLRMRRPTLDTPVPADKELADDQ